MTDQTNETTTKLLLIKKAMAARSQAYAPYSNYQVGVALLTIDGSIYCGTNVENAAYPLGTCAEATAIGNMVLGDMQEQEKSRMITKLVVAGPSVDICTPCGGCRQKIREFAGPDLQIIVCDVDGNILLEIAFDELLPHSFGPDNLTFN